LHVKDIALLNSIQSFFGVGTVYKDKINKFAIYSVGSVKDLTNVIIPHFCKYKLLTQKQADFELFKSVVEIINRKDHLISKGIENVLSIKS
jgi:hypothetical protein